MKIFLLAIACLIAGAIAANRMTHDGTVPGCPGAPASTPAVGR